MENTCKIIIALTVSVLAILSQSLTVSAQEHLFPESIQNSPEMQDSLKAPEGYMYIDSTIVRFADALDSTLIGKNIFELMPSKLTGDKADVKIHQSMPIRSGLSKHIESNKARTLEGYRVRIFFDNKQSSRVASEKMMEEFRKLYPEIPAYRNHVNPYFKVTVGDFRSRSEAMQLLKLIAGKFPTAFVVKENINYPAIDKEHPTETDTVKVLRPVNADGTAVRMQEINL